MNFDRMRELFLDQAIRGELVSQLAEEGVVEQIGAAPEEVPFKIPESWSWIRVEELAVKRKTIDPSTLTNDEIELWSIPAFDAGVAEKVSPGDIGSSKKVVQVGDVLLAKIVPHIKRVWVVSESANSLIKLASTEWLVYASELFLPEFMGLLFRAPYFRTKMMGSVSGMGSLKRANPRILAKVWLPVPPIKEQERIVTRLEDAFAEIDRAEKAYGELQTLAGVLRGQILQEAIEGKLVPQLAEEGVVEQIGAGECQDFCVWGGYSRGSPTRLPFVFEMQYARPDAIAGAKVEGPARSAGGSSLAPAIARREAAGALAREV